MAPLRRKTQERLIGFLLLLLAPRRTGSNPAVLLGQSERTDLLRITFRSTNHDKIYRRNIHLSTEGWLECRNQATRGSAFSRADALERTRNQGCRDSGERRRLNENGELFLYRAKTGSPVYVPLPPEVAEALRNSARPQSESAVLLLVR